MTLLAIFHVPLLLDCLVSVYFEMEVCLKTIVLHSPKCLSVRPSQNYNIVENFKWQFYWLAVLLSSYSYLFVLVVNMLMMSYKLTCGLFVEVWFVFDPILCLWESTDTTLHSWPIFSSDIFTKLIFWFDNSILFSDLNLLIWQTNFKSPTP